MHSVLFFLLLEVARFLGSHQALTREPYVLCAVIWKHLHCMKASALSRNHYFTLSCSAGVLCSSLETSVQFTYIRKWETEGGEEKLTFIIALSVPSHQMAVHHLFCMNKASVMWWITDVWETFPPGWSTLTHMWQTKGGEAHIGCLRWKHSSHMLHVDSTNYFWAKWRMAVHESPETDKNMCCLCAPSQLIIVAVKKNNTAHVTWSYFRTVIITFRPGSD